jgi:DUF4097 and DUF4098 domain-containing protein YvlB
LFIAAIGVVLLLANLGVISWHNFGWWFARYWPLLLIFWGVVKFAEYFWARSHNEPAPGIGGGGVVFLVFLVFFGLAATSASRANWSWVDNDPGNDWDALGIFGTRYDFTSTVTQPMLSGNQVRIVSPRGNITITPSPDDQAHLFVHKYTRSHSQAEANQFDNATHPTFQQQGSLWLLDLDTTAYHQGRFDMELQLPAKYSVSLVNRRGDIHISQMQADIDIETSHGDITAEQIKGNAVLRLDHGDVTAKGINGNLSVDGDVGDSNVADVSGLLSFSGSYTGDIQLSHVGNQVRFRSIRTDLQFAKLDGDLHMDRGSFQANALAGPLVLRTDAKEIHMQDATGDLQIEDRRGDVEVQAKAPIGNVAISTTGGEIDLKLPDSAGFQVDAQSDGGSIQSDYSLNINNDRHNATATGSVGNGKSQVKLRTNRGTIEIRKE